MPVAVFQTADFFPDLPRRALPFQGAFPWAVEMLKPFRHEEKLIQPDKIYFTKILEILD